MEEWFINTPTISVLVDETRKSSVLDQAGNPIYLEKKMKIGFDLTSRKKQCT